MSRDLKGGEGVSQVDVWEKTPAEGKHVQRPCGWSVSGMWRNSQQGGGGMAKGAWRKGSRGTAGPAEPSGSL